MNLKKANALLKQTKENIARSGRSIFVVSGDDETPDFGYTVGDNKLEFVLFGNIPSQAIQGILNTVWAAFKTPSAGKPTDLNTSLRWHLNSAPIKLVEVSPVAAGKYNLFCQNVYNKLPKRVIQVLITDVNGKYPGEFGYDENFEQVVLPTLQ